MELVNGDIVHVRGSISKFNPSFEARMSLSQPRMLRQQKCRYTIQQGICTHILSCNGTDVFTEYAIDLATMYYKTAVNEYSLQVHIPLGKGHFRAGVRC